MSFTLDNGIPLPARTVRGPAAAKRYPLDSMAVMQSFFVPLEAESTMQKDARRLASACAAARKRNADRKFSVRARTENGVEGHRIWRVQ